LKYTPQVRDYIAALPPEMKKRFNTELKKLAAGGGDIRALRPPLDGYNRLRIGAHRVIYEYVSPSTISCVFAGDRANIYQLFSPPDKTPKED
jgi:mRNA-degrading endonuclease RelE of RelBE toxin-antitoxin system